jgi:hypothetical protein
VSKTVPVKESKVILELRKQNRKLKAENRQLRKNNRRHVESEDVDQFEAYDPEPESTVTETKITCPVCGNYTKNIFEILPGKTYYKCDCGSKGPVTPQIQRK